MDVKFIMTAECRVDDIDCKPPAEDIARELENILNEECGIKAVIEISGLTYVGEKGQEETHG